VIAITEQQRRQIPGVRLQPVTVQQDDMRQVRVAPVEVVEAHTVQVHRAIFRQ
jgi:anti-sigma factor ChrR (cupin superfamily)